MIKVHFYVLKWLPDIAHIAAGGHSTAGWHFPRGPLGGSGQGRVKSTEVSLVQTLVCLFIS